MHSWWNVAVKAVGVAAVAVVGIMGSPARANGFLGGLGGIGGGTFGTKFVCCRPESVSCLGGGGATVWHTLLRDRALTQVDAQARCGVSRMYWATHSCPADTACAGSSGGTSPSNIYSVNVRNSGNRTVFLAHQTTSKGTHRIKTWFELKGGQNREFKYANGSSCVAVYQGGDWIKKQQDSGSIFTGTMKTLWSHPNKQTEITYAKGSNGRYWVEIFVRDVQARKRFDNLDENGVKNLFKNRGVTSFKCFQATNENHHIGVEG